MAPTLLTWLGIVLLILQSGIFSGLNLALFGLSALRLRAMADTGNEKARALFEMREDSNFLLTTILWGNVATNVLLALLAESVMAGLLGFLFSTVVITICGEIIPQAYFSRHALRVASLLTPGLRLYQFLLYPVAKPSAWLLDRWLGKESIDYVPEEELMELLRHHIHAPESDVGHVEGHGAINFLALDDLLVTEEGEPVDPLSIVALPMKNDRPVFPDYASTPQDGFIRQIQCSRKRWVILTDPAGHPVFTLDSASFLTEALFCSLRVDPMEHCHRPLIVTNRRTKLSDVIAQFETAPGDDNIRQDVILIWGEEQRIITGSDLFGYLMRGIAKQVH
jgi:hypothetical protein